MAGKKDKNKSGEHKKQSKCKGCGQPNPKHMEDNCLQTNKEKRKEWEKKNGKKWVPWSKYQEQKEKEDKAHKKSKESDSEDEHFLMPIFSTAKKAYNAIDRDRWLPDTGATDHIANSKSQFDTYRDDDHLPYVDTANGKSKPQGIGTVVLRCPKSSGGVATLTLEKVLYMPDVPVNLFSGRRLLDGGGLIGDGVLLSPPNKNGVRKEMCQYDDCFFIIEEDMTRAMPALLPAALRTAGIDIELWHRRFGHLGLDNLRQTQRITRGMELRKREEALQMKLCEPCEMAKPIRHVRKTVRPERCVLRIFDQIHADVVKIKPVGYNKHIYGLILMDGATKVRWAYTFEHKGDAFKCIMKFI